MTVRVPVLTGKFTLRLVHLVEGVWGGGGGLDPGQSGRMWRGDLCDMYLHMKSNRDRVYDCTSSSFDG